MRQLIKRTFPTHGIVGEEFGAEQTRCRIRLGARSDRRHQGLHGRPAALGHADRPDAQRRAGLRPDAPAVHGRALLRRRRQRRPTAAGGERKLMTRRCASLTDAIISTTSPRCSTARSSPPTSGSSARAASPLRLRLLRLLHAAAGHIDLVIEAGLKPYDIVALIPIIEGAGGIVTDLGRRDAAKGGSIVAAGDRRVHEAASRPESSTGESRPVARSGVPGMKASKAAQNSSRISSRSIRISCRAPGQHDGVPGLEAGREALHRRRRADRIGAGRDDQRRQCGSSSGKRGSANLRFMKRKASIAGDGRVADAPSPHRRRHAALRA